MGQSVPCLSPAFAEHDVAVQNTSGHTFGKVFVRCSVLHGDRGRWHLWIGVPGVRVGDRPPTVDLVPGVTVAAEGRRSAGWNT